MYEKEAFSHQRDAGLAGRRTEYQRDRDKILYSRSFRRLRLKTQVFPEHTGDYLRTRLDHTLEVAQIARHFARQLDLNEDLVDAIALGHDIGHAPFGHSGERALHMFLRKVNRKRKKRDPEAEDLDGFKHNWQGLRVVDRLERSYPEHPGLNLTRAVRIGILKHTPMEYKEKSGLVFAKWPGSRCSCDMRDELEPGLDPDDSRCDIFEVQVCSLADEIAQLIHEFEDAIVSEPFVLEKIILDENGHPFIGQCLDAIRDRACKARESGARLPAGWTDSRKFDFGNQGQRRILVARLRSEMIFKLTTAVLEVARAALSAWEAEHLKGSDREESIQEFNRHVTAESGFDPLIRLEGTPTAESFEELREWVRDHVVSSERVNRMDGKADYVLRHILDLYLDKPKQAHQRVLDQYMDSREHKNSEAKGKDIRRMRDPEIKRLNLDMSKTFVRAAVDHVAGMTDRFALREYDQLYSAYPRLQL